MLNNEALYVREVGTRAQCATAFAKEKENGKVSVIVTTSRYLHCEMTMDASVSLYILRLAFVLVAGYIIMIFLLHEEEKKGKKRKWDRSEELEWGHFNPTI